VGMHGVICAGVILSVMGAAFFFSVLCAPHPWPVCLVCAGTDWLVPKSPVAFHSLGLGLLPVCIPLAAILCAHSFWASFLCGPGSILMRLLGSASMWRVAWLASFVSTFLSSPFHSISFYFFSHLHSIAGDSDRIRHDQRHS